MYFTGNTFKKREDVKGIKNVSTSRDGRGRSLVS